ncbi:MAG: baseplate J/gp47 family protein [Candidatus Pacebacteria bacterium]|nr:baseplate J/gp47 family protein [Candidatus Paceibacterota bacterium]MCF7862922.1 baseplate J/gp47 family protein [Candidatus Paceibacterota bacterium]
MPKNIFEDMVKTKNQQRSTASGKKSIDAVNKKQFVNSKKIEQEDSVPKDDRLDRIEKTRRENEYQFQSSAYTYSGDFNGGDSKYGIWVIAFIAILFLFFAVSLLFVKATVTVNPETKVLSMSEDFIASKGNSSKSFSFDLMVLTGEEKVTVLGGEEKEVKESAKGTVIIYNNFSLAPQALDINTRLETIDGKIYKTVEKVIVPGMQKEDVPGQIQVDIFASEAGEEYNSPPLDFKILGFKGSPKYEKFFARSVGDISGGKLGITREVSVEKKEESLKKLESSLRDKLMEKAKNQIPAGFILWTTAIFFEKTNEKFTIGDPKDALDYKEGTEEEATTISMDAVLYGFIFNEEVVAKEILKNIAPNENEQNVYISNIKDIKFTLQNAENVTSKNINSIRDINFALSGNPLLVYKFDDVSFASDIAGKNKKDFEKIMNKYSHVISAESSIKPVWKKSFPEDMKKIHIIVNYP